MTPSPPRIYLASRSPRRRQLLHQVHVAFDLLPFRAGGREDPQVCEDPMIAENAVDYVQRLARAKATHAVSLLAVRRLALRPVLAADTTIELDDEIIGKPVDAEDAELILRRLVGRSHRVLTAVALAEGRRIETALSESEVRIAAIGEDELHHYVATGEPMDKAGAYGIQGYAASFIEEIRGSYSGIMGLPLFETVRLLRRFDLAY